MFVVSYVRQGMTDLGEYSKGKASVGLRFREIDNYGYFPLGDCYRYGKDVFIRALVGLLLVLSRVRVYYY